MQSRRITFGLHGCISAHDGGLEIGFLLQLSENERGFSVSEADDVE